jgi:hypothetical protein
MTKKQNPTNFLELVALWRQCRDKVITNAQFKDRLTLHVCEKVSTELADLGWHNCEGLILTARSRDLDDLRHFRTWLLSTLWGLRTLRARKLNEVEGAPDEVPVCDEQEQRIYMPDGTKEVPIGNEWLAILGLVKHAPITAKKLDKLTCIFPVRVPLKKLIKRCQALEDWIDFPGTKSGVYKTRIVLK